MKKFSIQITTKNRKSDLFFTLQKLQKFFEREDVACIVCDDASTDGTFEMVREHFPQVQTIRNKVSRGLIANRNRMLNSTESDYVISLDDDANFLTTGVLEAIEKHFTEHPKCGVIAFRIFWSKTLPDTVSCDEQPERVKGFVGCGHVWRREAWEAIPNYPDWFIFYGEEDFAAFQLFKHGWEIHYVPEVLVHHRVDISSRKKQNDYRLRTRRSFRSGWYLYLLFYPLSMVPKKMVYTLWQQFKIKLLKGDWSASLGVLQAIGDVFLNLPRMAKQSNRLSLEEFKEFSKLPEAKIYWTPKK